MNWSNVQHFLLFVAAMFFISRTPHWLFLVFAGIAIEINQAVLYAVPWWKWFLEKDTIVDLIADTCGILLICLAEYLWKKRETIWNKCKVLIRRMKISDMMTQINQDTIDMIETVIRDLQKKRRKHE